MSKVAVKGIRVNQLAKELGVESKSILNKCREEGLGEKVPNHMSVLSVGLAETVREWFSGGDIGGGSTAVQTAPPVETKAKPRKIVKKAIGHDEEPTNGNTVTPPAPWSNQLKRRNLLQKSRSPKRLRPSPLSLLLAPAPVKEVAPAVIAQPPVAESSGSSRNP